MSLQKAPDFTFAGRAVGHAERGVWKMVFFIVKVKHISVL